MIDYCAMMWRDLFIELAHQFNACTNKSLFWRQYQNSTFMNAMFLFFVCFIVAFKTINRNWKREIELFHFPAASSISQFKWQILSKTNHILQTNGRKENHDLRSEKQQQQPRNNNNNNNKSNDKIVYSMLASERCAHI